MPSSINSDYNNDINSWPEIERQIANISKAGFTHIQWIHDWEGDYLYNKSEIYHVRDMLRHYGLNAHTVHATEGGVRTVKKPDGTGIFRNKYRLTTDIRKDYTSTAEFIRLAGVELLRNRVDLCAAIGAKVMVLHLQLPYKMFEENEQDKHDYFNQVYKSLDALKPYAEVAGVKIAMENLICTPVHHQEDSFDRLFDRYDFGFLGFCYDSGHAALHCRNDYYYFLKKYNARLIACHLQDTNSISDELAEDDWQVLKHDLHAVPFSGGVMDWEKVAELVAKAPLDLPADFEVVFSGKTPEEEFAKLEDCRKKAELFYNKVLSYKK